MVEVFKTNIDKTYQSNWVLDKFKRVYPDYRLNYDLDDCDNILRVESHKEVIDSEEINKLIKVMGFHSELLS